MDERPTKETIIDDNGETGTNERRQASLLPPPPLHQLPSLLPSPLASSTSHTMTQSSIKLPQTPSSSSMAQKPTFTAQNELRRSAPPSPSSPLPSPSAPLDPLLFAKRPVPLLRQATLPLPSPIILSRSSSFASSASSSCLGFAGDDGVASPSSPTDKFTSSPSSPSAQPISLLSQILVTHSHKLSALTGGAAVAGALSSPLSSTPNSTASSPVAGASAQLHGIFKRRGSTGACEVLDKVGEEDTGIEGQLEGFNMTASTMVPRSSIFTGPSPNLSPRSRSIASSPSKRFLPPPPPSPTRPPTAPRAPSRLMFSEPDRNSSTSTSTPDFHSSPEATSSSFPSSPVAGIVELPLPPKRVGLVFVEDPEIVSRRSISTAPPSPTQPSLPPPTLALPQKKPSNLTFAVTSVCARPPAMGKTPGPDREMEDDEEEEEEDDDLNDEVDVEEDDEDEDDEEEDRSLDEDGYLEDDEEDASSEEDEEGVSSSPAERRRYRYKRHALFGEDSTDEDEEDEEDGFGGDDDVDEDGSLRTRNTARDSVLSNFSFDKPIDDSPEAVSKRLAENSLRHRRSASLKRRSASMVPSDPPPPVPPLPSTSNLLHPNSSTTAPKSLSARRTHFPTPLVLRQDHSAFPRSPVPKSIVRGGGGYSPRVRKGTRMAAGVQSQAQDATRARLGRDDFLPTHLKSEEGKERERERERERDSTTDQGGGVSSGKCSRHRSPPPSSTGRDKMKAHGERRSRSVVAGGEGSRVASSSRTRTVSADVGCVALALPLPPPPPPILKRNPASTSAAPSSRVVTTGDLTPVFLTDTEETFITRQPPSAFRPTLLSPTTITTISILQSVDILSPPSSRRASSSERRASLSAVCSVFQRPSFSTTSAHNSDDPSSQSTVPRLRRPSIALDGSSSAPYTQRSAGGGASFVDGSALTQSLQKALGGGERSLRPFSPPPTAPSSFVPPRFSSANLPAASSSVPTRLIVKRRFSQPPIPTTSASTKTTTPAKSRPIACPAPGRVGGWTDGG